MSPATLIAIADFVSDSAQKLRERLGKGRADQQRLLDRIAELERWSSELWAEAHYREMLMREATPPTAPPEISPAIRRRWAPHTKRP